MPKSSFPANAEGLSKFSRRVFLKSSPVAVAGVAGCANLALADERVTLSPEERMMAAFEVFKQAVDEVYPGTYLRMDKFGTKDELVPVIIVFSNKD